MTKEEAKDVLEQSLIELKAIGEDPFGEHEPSQFSQKQIEEALQVAIDILSKPFLPSNLEEAAKEYFENSENSWEVRDVFKAGAKWQKEQMLSKPVEGEVKDFRFVREINYASANIEFDSIPELKEGDRVCMIVLSKED